LTRTLPFTNQRARCAKVLEERHSALLSSLPPYHQESMHENASLLGRLAPEAISSSKAFYLTNRQVSTALHHHTLYSSSDNTCQCGEPINFGLAEICPSFEPVKSLSFSSQCISNSFYPRTSYPVLPFPSLKSLTTRCDDAQGRDGSGPENHLPILHGCTGLVSTFQPSHIILDLQTTTSLASPATGSQAQPGQSR
jgi:hypothetical protein